MLSAMIWTAQEPSDSDFINSLTLKTFFFKHVCIPRIIFILKMLIIFSIFALLLHCSHRIFKAVYHS